MTRRLPRWRPSGRIDRRYAFDQEALQGVDLRLLEYAYRREGGARDLFLAGKTLKVSETYVTVAVARLETNHYLEPDKTYWKLTPKGALSAQVLASTRRSRPYLWLCVLVCSTILVSIFYGLLAQPRTAGLSLLPTIAVLSLLILYGVWMLRNHFASRSARDTLH